MNKSQQQPRGAGDWYDAIADAALDLEIAAILTAAVRFIDWTTGERLRPGVRTWAERARMSERTLQRHLPRALALGVLVETRPATRTTPAEYRIDYPTLTAMTRLTGDAAANRENDGWCQSVTTVVSNCHHGGDNLTPGWCQSVTPSPSENTKTKEREGAPACASPLADFEAWFNAYPKHRRTDYNGCLREWASNHCDSCPSEVIAGLEAWKASEEWIKDGGKFVPAARKFLATRKWESRPNAPEAIQCDFRSRRRNETDGEYAMRLLQEGVA